MDSKAGQKSKVALRSLVIFSPRQWMYSDLLLSLSFKLTVHSAIIVSNGLGKISDTHNSFDRDVV